MNNRRQFILHLSAGSSVLLAGHALAQGANVLETDVQAGALGYKADTTKVDGKKYPNHTVAQNCKGCALYQGKPADVAGACPLFAGKQVAASGWCSAWAKKA